ncbi:MAG: prolyl-tRNA synthetase [Candidatus Peribacteria bacterium]|jgi:prolyl-tRNA synthetase|nr:prolyl-tRNA synthetase [Candidatus Peribacteria bacterium]
MSQYPFQSARLTTTDNEMESTNLLLQAGYIRQEVAGAYNYLHLGIRTLNNIRAIIKKNLETFGSHEIWMTSIGAREHWEQTERDTTVDVLFKIEFSDGRHNFLNPTHEEVVTPLMKEFIKSYRDLPTSVFQIQTKFRNEKRAKSGILRGREFLMKDMYSFHATPEDLDAYYQQVIDVYHQIFKELGIGDDTYLTYASGGTFSKYSHEFQTLTPLGEDVIYVDREKKLALNKEIITIPAVKAEFKNCRFEEVRASEVGNIFKLATTFSVPFDVKYADREGNLQEVSMGCYGIGVSRTMGIIAEKLKDEK